MAISAALRHWVLRLLPPVLTDAIRRRLPRANAMVAPVTGSRPEWEYLPGGWELSDTNVKGWNVASVVAIQRKKWPDFLRSVAGTGPYGIAHEGNAAVRDNASAHNTIMSFGYVLGVAGAGQGRLSALDWGGGVGNFYVFARALWPECVFSYTCKDLPLMVAAGRELLPGCRFEDDDDRALADGYDLVMSSSSLQYVRDWQALVARLCMAARKFLYVTRIPVVSSHRSFVVVQRPYAYGYDTEYLGWFFNRDELILAVEGNGFRLLREFIVDERPLVRNAPEQCNYSGFLFERRSKK
jgi:putative methyltransferase (TIGR04325 family)